MKNDIIFKHEWGYWFIADGPSLCIVDSEKDNVVISDNRYTVPYEQIEELKEHIAGSFETGVPECFPNKVTLFILDGSSHTIYLYDSRTDSSAEVRGDNISYWFEYDYMDEYKADPKRFMFFTDEPDETYLPKFGNLMEILKYVDRLLRENKVCEGLFEEVED